MRSPRISVIMPSYNHAPFVLTAIKSVLDQDFDDFEFLIEDDGSSDGTPDVISSISDKRIRLFVNENNIGACTITNNLIKRASGNYIALINSDDQWLPGKLSWQFEFLERNPEFLAVFGRVRYIDSSGDGISKDSFQWGNVFDRPNRSGAKWLRHFLFNGNCICHPTMLIRRKTYDVTGLYDNRLRQLPDFDMWIRLAKAGEMHISEQPLINFRLLLGHANASGDTPRNAVRVINEYMIIVEKVFDDISQERFREGFHDLLRYKIFPSEIHFNIEKAFVLLTPNPGLDHMFKILAIQKINKFMNDDNYRAVLASDYDFDDRAFHELTGSADAFRPAR